MGYNAVPTSRNTKAVDLIVHNPKSDKAVGVQVKTRRQQHKNNPSKDGYWVTRVIPKEMQRIKDEFSNPFVFVYIPNGEKPTPRFFVVPKQDIYELCKANWESYVKESKHKDIKKTETKSLPLGPNVKQLEPYEDEWKQLGLEQPIVNTKSNE